MSDKPKMPANMYFRFCKDNRDKLKKANSALTGQEFTKLLAGEYAKMDEKSREKKYGKNYHADMAVYRTALAAWN